MRTSRFAFAALVGTLALGSIANAGVTTPGSLVVFPEFDNRVFGNNVRNWTLLTLTNTNPTESVWVHVVYRNHSDIPSQDCLETNRFYRLTANDTITLLTQFDNPNRDQGFVYVYATQSNSSPRRRSSSTGSSRRRRTSATRTTTRATVRSSSRPTSSVRRPGSRTARAPTVTETACAT